MLRSLPSGFDISEHAYTTEIAFRWKQTKCFLQKNLRERKEFNTDSFEMMKGLKFILYILTRDVRYSILLEKTI